MYIRMMYVPTCVAVHVTYMKCIHMYLQQVTSSFELQGPLNKYFVNDKIDERPFSTLQHDLHENKDTS